MKTTLGEKGETLIEKYLSSKGYEIKQKNYYTRYGEIDIVAVDTIKQCLVFVEVKTRKTETYGSPNESITKKKKTNLLKTALHFLNNAIQNKYISWRIDLLTLQLKRKERLVRVTHYKNILNE